MIGVITYDYPHLKTEQVLHSFIKKGYALKIYGLPFAPRKARRVIFQHRPNQTNATHPATIAQKHGIEYVGCWGDQDIDSGCDVYHVLIGRIISEECLVGKRIINCHPGILPAVRGLDAFKWAIYKDNPLGVTLHYIDKDVDRGEIIAVESTAVYASDTIETLARRHYENEIEMTSNFKYYMAPASNDCPRAEGKRHMRMGPGIESRVLKSFGRYVRRHMS